MTDEWFQVYKVFRPLADGSLGFLSGRPPSVP